MPSKKKLRISLSGALVVLLMLGALPATAQEAEDPGPVEIILMKAWFDAEGEWIPEAPDIDWGLSMETGPPDDSEIVASLPGEDNTATFEWSEFDGQWHASRYGIQETPSAAGWEAVACDGLTFDHDALPAPLVQTDTSELKVEQGAPDGSMGATSSGVHLICNQRMDPADVEPLWPDLSVDNTHYEHIIDLAIDGILLGHADGTFGPALAVTRGQVASVLAKTAGVEGVVLDTPTFSDIGGTTHEANIEALVESEVISGYADGTFRPNLPVTRAQVATMLGRWLDVEELADGPFDDVAADNTHAGYINALANAGIISGTTATTFEPQADIRRDQFAALVNRAR